MSRFCWFARNIITSMLTWVPGMWCSFFCVLFFSFRPPALILLSDPDEKQRKKPHGLSIFFTVLYLDAKKLRFASARVYHHNIPSLPEFPKAPTWDQFCFWFLSMTYQTTLTSPLSFTLMMPSCTTPLSEAPLHYLSEANFKPLS